MGWISLLMAFAIGGMGGAPIAEKFDLPWLMYILTGIAYVSVALLAVAAIFVGGLGLWHGILVILGKEVGTFSGERKPEPKPLPGNPQVERPVEDASS